ncbi:MAG TPA: pyridoxamine 5'-phosphate oxidase family protein, partial [Polyangiaceae bacterium]
NNLFMTLGNLAVRPRAGLAFVDFASGTLLSLVGSAETIWEGPELASFHGAERLLRIRVVRGVIVPGAIPFTWSASEPARQLDRTGSW